MNRDLDLGLEKFDRDLGRREPQATASLDVPVIVDPHSYYNAYFRDNERGDQRMAFSGQMRDVFDRSINGEEELPQGLQGEYSDRLREWDKEKYTQAYRATRSSNQGAGLETARNLQNFLSQYYEKPVRLWKVGTMMDNRGWPILGFQFEFTEAE